MLLYLVFLKMLLFYLSSLCSADSKDLCQTKESGHRQFDEGVVLCLAVKERDDRIKSLESTSCEVSSEIAKLPCACS